MLPEVRVPGKWRGTRSQGAAASRAPRPGAHPTLQPVALEERLHALCDLAIEDVLRVQHMMGRESGRARRDMLTGVPVDRESLEGVPALVIGESSFQQVAEGVRAFLESHRM